MSTNITVDTASHTEICSDKRVGDFFQGKASGYIYILTDISEDADITLFNINLKSFMPPLDIETLEDFYYFLPNVNITI